MAGSYHRSDRDNQDYNIFGSSPKSVMGVEAV
jgi:hypothetical protein